MRHVRDGSLRRLLDEPVGVSDAETRHLRGCARCRRRSAAAAADAALAGSVLAPERRLGTVAAQLAVPADIDESWSRLATRMRTEVAPRRAVPRRAPRRWRLAGSTLGGGTALAGAGVVLAGVAAAASLSTTVFAPTAVAPLPVTLGDMQPLAELLDVNAGSDLHQLRTASGSQDLAFGTLDWTSSGTPHEVDSVAAAAAASGLDVPLPATVPSGVGSLRAILVLPRVTATVLFDSRAGSLAGSTLQATVGPAVVVSYGGSAGAASPTTLAVLTAAQPLATSSGASTTQLEDFLLAQPGVPAELATQLRLLGDLQSTLPVPALPGLVTESTTVGAARAVAMRDPSNAVSGVIWQDGSRTVHAVAGLLDEQDVLGVAGGLG